MTSVLGLALMAVMIIASSFALGGTLMIFYSLIYNKFLDRKLKKNIPKENLIPPQFIQNDKEVDRDESRRKQQYREFEKLRRLSNTRTANTGKSIPSDARREILSFDDVGRIEEIKSIATTGQRAPPEAERNIRKTIEFVE